MIELDTKYDHEKVETGNEKEDIYDLAGRKIKTITTQGIYIINGKRVLVK